MPDWILAPICLIALLGFIWFAFRQGCSVKPDNGAPNPSTWPVGPDGNFR